MATTSSRVAPAGVFTQPSVQLGNPFEPFENEWNVGLFSCCDDIGQCCYAYFCCCCFYCSLAEKVGESKCSCCCVPSALALYRMKVRSVLRIKGDSCNDYCATSCCGLCAALQIENELKYRGLSHK